MPALASKQISAERSAIALRLRKSGLQFREIAAVMRITANSARNYVARGERHRREQILNAVFTPLA